MEKGQVARSKGETLKIQERRKNPFVGTNREK